jgi:DNA topoisomerase-1
VGLEALIEQKQSQIDYPAIDVGLDPGTGQPIRVRIGRYGPFLQRGEGGEGNTASLPDDLPPADLTVEHAAQLLEAKALGPQDLGPDPASGLHVYVIVGRFGAYVQLGETEKGSKEKPRRASLVAGMSEKTITLDQALQLLSLPRDLGTHPESGKTIVAGQGRFGPYVKHGDEFRSLEETDDVFTIDLARAVELLAAPKKSRGRKTAARTVLKEVGAHPRGGAMINLLAGRYGPYVNDGTTNASLPKSMSPEQITLEQAVELLAAREGAPKKAKTARRASAGRKPTRKRAATVAS